MRERRDAVAARATRRGRPTAAPLGWLLGFAFCVTLACSAGGARPVPQVEVTPGVFEIRVPAFGELRAAEATPIQVPITLRGVQRVEWLAPEGTTVAAGEPVARMDGEEVENNLEQAIETLRGLEDELEAKRAQLEAQRRQLEGEMTLLADQRDKAETFAPRDPELFSRHEILDWQMDVELIDLRITDCRTRLERHVQRSAAELEILRLRREAEDVKRARLERTRADLVVRAPHGGFFLWGKNWRGEKVQPGMALWGGGRLGELPDVTRMEAVLQVLESDAAGVSAGQLVEVVVDASPASTHTARVSGIQPVANAIEEESPVKYFEVTAVLDATDTRVMKPASRVRGTIVVARRDEVVAVPNQAIFHKGEDTWVWVDGAAGWEKRPVAIGERSTSRTVVTSGLSRGERVALVEPASEDSG